MFTAEIAANRLMSKRIEPNPGKCAQNCIFLKQMPTNRTDIAFHCSFPTPSPLLNPSVVYQSEQSLYRHLYDVFI